MPTIPFSQVVKIVPGVLAGVGNALDLNAVVLTQSQYAPQNQVLDFTTQADVADYFGPTSVEASIASSYFQGPDNAASTPGMIKFLAYAESAVAGFLLGASMASVPLATLQGYSGTLIITVAGTQYTSSTIALSGATSFSDAASLMQAGFTTPPFTITFDSIHQAFFVVTASTGSTETITYCTGTLASDVKLDSASAGTLSQGADAAVPATQMNWLVANDQNWASFLTAWSSTLTEREAFADWTNTQSNRFWYLAWDTDTADLTPTNSASFGGYLASSKDSGTSPFYGTQQHAAFAASWAASLNFSQRNGRSTLCFRSQSGLATSVNDSTTYSNVTSNGYNVYGSFGSNNPANNDAWMTPGVVSGSFAWADTYVCQIQLNAQLQLGIVKGMRSVGQIPYNSDGDALIEGFCRSPIKAALNFGTIRKGVTLSASQVQQVINLVGKDVSSTITSQGYYLYTNAAGTSSTVRAQRGSPPATLLYQDGESIQSVTMPSIVIQ